MSLATDALISLLGMAVNERLGVCPAELGR
jgi:hypothetical protein